MNIVILMASDSQDFEKHGYSYPRYILEIQNRPLIQHIVESLHNFNANIIFLIRKEDDDKYFLSSMLKVLVPAGKILLVENTTKGAICTALFAIDYINNSDTLVILNGDQLIKTGIKQAMDDFIKRSLDGGIITFESIHPRWSYVAVDNDGMVIQTSEKRPISNRATAGCYYFKSGADFVSACFSVIEKDAQVQGKYYISFTYNELILQQKKIGIYQIPRKDYISFAAYQLYENYVSSNRSNEDD